MNSFVDDATKTLAVVHISNDIYHELHDREIRLVTLLKGQWSEKISCRLHHATLANKPRYKALSYAWGSPRVTRPILLNGTQHRVTVNLESALRRIRRMNEDLIIWIDALSINQLDSSERAEQVKLMHDIYALTEEVLVYLGEPLSTNLMGKTQRIPQSRLIFHCDERDHESLNLFRDRCLARASFQDYKGKQRIDSAFDLMCFLRLLSDKVEIGSLPAFEPQSRLFVDTPYQRDVFESLRQLLLCRWWNRIWVIQEIVVPQNVTTIYGSTVIPWDMLAAAADWESRNRQSSTPYVFPQEYSKVLSHFSRNVLDIQRMRTLWKNGMKSTLLPLLQQFRGRKASDDRDKVFALLSLAGQQTRIVPNYAMDVATVFKTAVFDIIDTSKSLAVFSGDLERKERRDLPSWIPDWSAAYSDLDIRPSSNIEQYRASGASQVYIQNKEDFELRAFRYYLKDNRGRYIVKRTADSIAQVTEFVGSEAWIDFLPPMLDSAPDSDTCLAALGRWYTAAGWAASVRDHGDGMVSVAGLEVDKVLRTGRIAISEEEVLSAIRNTWNDVVHSHFRDKTYDKSPESLAKAFRRTICADFIHPHRGLDDSTHRDIATWFLQQRTKESFASGQSLWETLFSDLGEFKDYDPSKAVPPYIEDAIKSATLRRTFFITAKGYIGLGPAKTEPGDSLYILLGSPTPFILRKSEHPKHSRRKAYQLVGDCYAHGLMDGEIMNAWWQNFHDNRVDASLQEFSRQRQEYFDRWTESRGELEEWRLLTADCRLFGLAINAQDNERAMSFCENPPDLGLLNWAKSTTLNQQLQMSRTQPTWVYKVCSLRMDELQDTIARYRGEMDYLAKKIVNRELQTDRTHIYLI